jgi:hypothetical protein
MMKQPLVAHPIFFASNLEVEPLHNRGAELDDRGKFTTRASFHTP